MRTSSTSCPINSASNSHLSLRSCSSSVSTSWKVEINFPLFYRNISSSWIEFLTHFFSYTQNVCTVNCII